MSLLLARKVGLILSDIIGKALLRLSKRVEYGLMALQYLAKRGSVATAREIADEYDISLVLLAKILQDLKRNGMIDSYQGVRGGYALMLAPQSISLSRVMNALEEDNSLTQCMTESGDLAEGGCSRQGTCTIRGPLHKLQETLHRAMDSVTIAQLL